MVWSKRPRDPQGEDGSVSGLIGFPSGLTNAAPRRFSTLNGWGSGFFSSSIFIEFYGYSKRHMEKKLDEIVAYAGQQADGVTTEAQLEALKAEVSGPNGRLTGFMKGMKDVPKEDRPAFGKRINEAKQSVQVIFDGILETVEALEIAAELGSAVDPSLSSPDFGPGSFTIDADPGRDLPYLQANRICGRGRNRSGNRILLLRCSIRRTTIRLGICRTPFTYRTRSRLQTYPRRLMNDICFVRTLPLCKSVPCSKRSPKSASYRQDVAFAAIPWTLPTALTSIKWKVSM